MKLPTNLLASFALFTFLTLGIYLAFELARAGYYLVALIPVAILLLAMGLGIYILVKKE
jgi:hypothetical protein